MRGARVQLAVTLKPFIMLLVAGCTGPEVSVATQDVFDQLPNNLPLPSDHGFAASFNTAGHVDLANNFFTPQGTNGRHCGTCHAPETGWGMTPGLATFVFVVSGGLDPLFADHLDTDTPTCDMSTVQARWNCTTMLRQGLFTRFVAPPATRDYDVIGASDPFGVGTTSKLYFFRRPLPTANFRANTVMWDGANTVGAVLRDGLAKQARGNITGAQEGPPPTDDVTFSIVDFELATSHAQIIVDDVGRLDSDGARGGPEAAAAQPLVAGRFDLFDAWQDSDNPRRRQIYRGQELFNDRHCGGCHSAANNGQNVDGRLFDIKITHPEFSPGLAVYTFQSRVTGEIATSTDPGRGIRSGNFADLNKLKVPNLRGLAARAPYFSNGAAKHLIDVVHHYEAALGFVFTADEEADLVAFLGAL